MTEHVHITEMSSLLEKLKGKDLDSIFDELDLYKDCRECLLFIKESSMPQVMKNMAANPVRTANLLNTAFRRIHQREVEKN